MKNIKGTIVYFTRYTRQGPSSRMRSYLYKDRLESVGYEVIIRSLFNDQYIEGLYAEKPQKSILNAFSCYFKRVVDIFRYSRKNRFIIIEKELLPYIPPLFERALKLFGIKYWVDIDDAVFHYYDETQNPVIKMLCKGKIDKVFEYSSLVLAGNEYLADRASVSNNNVIIFPTVIDTDLYDSVSLSKEESKSSCIIGWIGSPSTVKYFEPIIPLLDELSLTKSFKLRVVGSNKRFKTDHLDIEYLKWQEETEVEMIKSFDVGIMPLQKSLFEKGKCGYKIIQYFGSKLPVVASPVGVNATIIDENENGFLPSKPDSWKESLSVLIDGKTMRNSFGNHGHNKIKNHYSLNGNVKKLITLLESNAKSTL